VTKPREEFESLAINKVRGEAPEILRGVWLDVPIYRVEVTVDAQGNVTDVYPLYGNSLLAEAALAAAGKWRFPPQHVNGMPGEVLSAVNVEFENPTEQRRHRLVEVAMQELQQRPDLAVSYYNAGFAYQFDHQFKEATDYFQQAISKAPDWAVAYVALGRAYRALDQADKALHCFLRATTLKTNYYEAFEGCGLIYTRLKRDQDALRSFLQSVEAAKSVRDKLWASRNLVTCYETLGQKKEAADAQMQVARQAARYSAVTRRTAIDTAEEAFLAGAKYGGVDDSTNAQAAFRLAMEIDPLSEPGLLARIMVAGHLRSQNKLDLSTALLKEMVNIANEAIRDYAANKNKYGLGCAYYWRGHALRDLGQLHAGIADLRKAVKYRPDWGEAHLRLAYAYVKVGDLRSAGKEYRISRIVDEYLAREIESASQRP
jgi:tetratricopeptide (TPR) repeat protein